MALNPFPLLKKVPLEIVLLIAKQLPIEDALLLALTCKDLWTNISRQLALFISGKRSAPSHSKTIKVRGETTTIKIPPRHDRKPPSIDVD
jgi:hypothetical protein